MYICRWTVVGHYCSSQDYLKSTPHGWASMSQTTHRSLPPFFLPYTPSPSSSFPPYSTSTLSLLLLPSLLHFHPLPPPPSLPTPLPPSPSSSFPPYSTSTLSLLLPTPFPPSPSLPPSLLHFHPLPPPPSLPTPFPPSPSLPPSLLPSLLHFHPLPSSFPPYSTSTLSLLLLPSLLHFHPLPPPPSLPTPLPPSPSSSLLHFHPLPSSLPPSLLHFHPLPPSFPPYSISTLSLLLPSPPYERCIFTLSGSTNSRACIFTATHTTCRIYPLEHFHRKYEVDEVHYTDKASCILERIYRPM